MSSMEEDYEVKIETVEEKKKRRRKRNRKSKKKSQSGEQKLKTPAITESSTRKKTTRDDDDDDVEYLFKNHPEMFVPEGMEEQYIIEIDKFYNSAEFKAMCKDPFYALSSSDESLSDVLKYMHIVSDTDDHDTDGGKIDVRYYDSKPRSKRIVAIESKD